MPSKVNCKMEKYILNQNNNNNRVVKPRPNLKQCKNESFQKRSEDFDIGNMSQTMDTLLELGQRLAGKIEKENLTILRRPKVFFVKLSSFWFTASRQFCVHSGARQQLLL